MVSRFGRFGEELAKIYTRQLLLGLEYLHSCHIAHRCALVYVHACCHARVMCVCICVCRTGRLAVLMRQLLLVFEYVRSRHIAHRCVYCACNCRQPPNHHQSSTNRH